MPVYLNSVKVIIILKVPRTDDSTGIIEYFDRINRKNKPVYARVRKRIPTRVPNELFYIYGFNVVD